MNFKVFEQGPSEGNRIQELHVWLAIDRDGNEGIISQDLPMPFGVIRHGPLMSSKLENAESLRPFAENARDAAAKQCGNFCQIELRSFIRKP